MLLDNEKSLASHWDIQPPYDSLYSDDSLLSEDKDSATAWGIIYPGVDRAE